MADICSTCGQPKDLCVCIEIQREAQKIKIGLLQRRFGKTVTTVEGIEKKEETERLGKLLKRELACGGTIKQGIIELQGSHRDMVKKILVREGFSQDQIR